jgi:Septum formation
VIAAIILAIAGFAVVYGTYWVGMRRASVALQTHQLKVGDCIQEWWGGTVLPPVVERSRCDGPHFGEVFAILTVPDTQDYPGDEAMQRLGDNCGRKFFEYAPNIPDGPTFKVAIGYPRANAWSNGARSLVCAAISKGERWSSIRE